MDDNRLARIAKMENQTLSGLLDGCSNADAKFRRRHYRKTGTLDEIWNMVLQEEDEKILSFCENSKMHHWQLCRLGIYEIQNAIKRARIRRGTRRDHVSRMDDTRLARIVKMENQTPSDHLDGLANVGVIDMTKEQAK